MKTMIIKFTEELEVVGRRCRLWQQHLRLFRNQVTSGMVFFLQSNSVFFGSKPLRIGFMGRKFIDIAELFAVPGGLKISLETGMCSMLAVSAINNTSFDGEAAMIIWDFCEMGIWDLMVVSYLQEYAMLEALAKTRYSTHRVSIRSQIGVRTNTLSVV